MNVQQVTEMDLVQKWWKQIVTLIVVVAMFVTLQQQQLHANEDIEEQKARNEKQDRKISTLADEQNKTNNTLNITNERIRQLTKKIDETSRDDKERQKQLDRLIMLLQNK